MSSPSGGLPLADVVPWIDVHGETRRRWTVCFDLSDGKWLTGPRPRIADVVFKRSYDPLPDSPVGEIAGRVRPFGLKYACRTGHEGRMVAPFETLRTAGRRGEASRPTAWRAQRLVSPFKQPLQLARARRHRRNGVVGHPLPCPTSRFLPRRPAGRAVPHPGLAREGRSRG